MPRLVFLLTCLLSVTSTLQAGQSLAQALSEARERIPSAHPETRLFLGLITEANFREGLDYAIKDYDNLLDQQEEAGQPQSAESVRAWKEVYRPIYQRILDTGQIPKEVIIRNCRMIETKPKADQHACRPQSFPIPGLNLRADIRQISPTHLGFSLPIISCELGRFTKPIEIQRLIAGPPQIPKVD